MTFGDVLWKVSAYLLSIKKIVKPSLHIFSKYLIKPIIFKFGIILDSLILNIGHTR